MLPLPGLVSNRSKPRRHFPLGRDPGSHLRHPRAQFLDPLQHGMPFPIRAVQVDGGSEFASEFERPCQQREVHLFVRSARSNLDGTFERANRAHAREVLPSHCLLAGNEKT